MMWPFGKQQPSRSSQLAKINPNDVGPAPTDPTLDNAARDTSLRIRDRAREIDRLSKEIVEMTTGLLKQFEANSDDPPSK